MSMKLFRAASDFSSLAQEQDELNDDVVEIKQSESKTVSLFKLANEFSKNPEIVEFTDEISDEDVDPDYFGFDSDEYRSDRGTVECPVCDGIGTKDFDTCRACGGDGRRSVRNNNYKQKSQPALTEKRIDCKKCDGAGDVDGKSCDRCAGDGVEYVREPAETSLAGLSGKFDKYLEDRSTQKPN